MPLQEKKVRFSENLSKVFPEANYIFESDHQPKILKKEEITVSNVQSRVKELSKGKLPDQLNFFSGEEKENLLKTHARKNVGVLNKGNKKFREYQIMEEMFFKKINLKVLWIAVKYIRIILILLRAYIIS